MRRFLLQLTPVTLMNPADFWKSLKETFSVNPIKISLWIAALSALYLTSLFNYNLFHSLAEFFGIIIAISLFVIAWNAQRFFANHYLLFISISYFFVALIDIIHILSFKGIGIFVSFDPTANLATQLWIAARYIQAISLLIAPIFLTKKMNVKFVFGCFLVLTTSVFASIFYWKIFPTAYIDETGLTSFKIISEYAISAMLIASAAFLYTKRKALNEKIVFWVLLSILFTIVSELSFTQYFGVYDFSNMMGHYLKIIAFYFFYKAIVETSLKNPFAYIFNDLEQTAETLRISETKFRTLVKLASDGIILTNNKGVIELCNDMAENMFGWKEEEVAGKSTIDVLFAQTEDKPNLDELIQMDSSNLFPYKGIEFRGVRKNGEEFPFKLSWSCWKSNNELFFCFIIEDITERKAMEKSLLEKRERLEKLVENLKILQLGVDNAFTHVVITNENGIVLYANKAAANVTGFEIEEMLGRTTSLWGRQMSAEYYKKFWKIIKEDKQTFAGEITNRRKNGQKYDAEIRVSPILDNKGEVKFFVAIERDITKEKEIDRAKTEFISLAAHQLRTPLTTLSLTSEMLLSGVFGDIPEEGRNQLSTMSLGIRDMAEMIETFLDVTKIEMRKFPIELKPLRLSQVIERTVSEILPQIKEKKLAFKGNFKENSIVLNLDKKVMHVILENILSNCVKYTPSGGEIGLYTEEKSDGVIIKISDTGIGIPADQQSKIFTKMFRAENVTEIKSEGSGLGLYLAKNLADQSGYKLSFESKTGKGTTFFFSIPK